MTQKRPPAVDIRDPTIDWLAPVQNALINTQGVFFIRGMIAETYYDADNEGDVTWKSYSKLARRICKVYMLATQHRPYELHAGIDIFDGPQRSSTNLVRCFSPSIDPHIDRGVFNIVYGNEKDLSGLELLLKGQYWDCAAYFRDSQEEFWCVVIPGFALQAFDDCFTAVRHRVANGSSEKRSVNFQCRLYPAFRLPSGKTVEEATRPAFERQRGDGGGDRGVKEEPEQFLVADIQSPCGAYRAILHADPAMTAEELKAVFVQHTQWGVKPQDLGLICHSGVGYFFEGSCLKDLAGVMDYPEPLRFTAHPRHGKARQGSCTRSS